MNYSTAILAITSLCGSLSATAAEATYLHCGHLIDVVNGKLLGETTIVVEGGKVRKSRPAPLLARRRSTSPAKPACPASSTATRT